MIVKFFASRMARSEVTALIRKHQTINGNNILPTERNTATRKGAAWQDKKRGGLIVDRPASFEFDKCVYPAPDFTCGDDGGSRKVRRGQARLLWRAQAQR
jgi:hypothetical protein